MLTICPTFQLYRTKKKPSSRFKDFCFILFLAVDFEIVTPKPFGGGGLLSFMKPRPAFQGGGLLSFMKRPAVSSEVRKPEGKIFNYQSNPKFCLKFPFS